MEVRDWLKRTSEKGRKLLKQIAFEGERFDVMGVGRCGRKCFFSVGHFFFCGIFFRNSGPIRKFVWPGKREDTNE